MNTFRLFAAVFFVVMTAAALAQTPYSISGLDTDLTLAEAVAQAEKLGGTCLAKLPRANEKDKNVQCEYSQCNDSSRAGECEEDAQVGGGPQFLSHPILSIALVAPGDASPLTRVVMVYQGDADDVAAGLIDAFGPTEKGGAPTDEKSWSSARRWSWIQGHYRMGLLSSPPLIILATDPSLVSVGTDGEPDAQP